MGFGGLIQTIDGRNELAKAELGGAFQFTEVALGSGQFHGAFASKSGLEDEAVRLPISKIRRDGAQVTLECDFHSKSAPRAFYFREIGIFANGKLCFYDNAGADAEYIDPDTSAIVKQKRLRFVLAISSEVELSVALDEGLYALEDDLRAHADDGSMHIGEQERQAWNAKQDALAIDSTLSSTSANPIQNKAVKAALDGKSSTGHTHAAATTTSSGFMSSTDKRKLNGVDEGANNYAHPSTHPASMVTQDTTHRFVTDAEKKAWDGAYAQSTGYTDQKVAELIGGDPETLGTLKDFAEAVKENGDLISGLNDAIGKKASQAELDTHTGNGTVHVTATDKANWDTDIAERAATFSQATARANIASGEKVKTILGKVKKFFADLKTVAFTGSYNDLSDKPTIPSTPEGVGAVSSAYLEEHFVADYISQKTIALEGVGWKKVAEVGYRDISTGSCIVDIKKQFTYSNNEYHRLMLLNTYQKYEFSTVADKSNSQNITKARLVTGAGGKSFIEIYYNYSDLNYITITIENTSVPSDLNSSAYKWKVIDPIADTETPTSGTVAATYDIPTNFNSGMLVKTNGSNAGNFVLKRQSNTAYGNLVDYYTHDVEPKYYRILIPKVATVWTMLFAEISFRQSHSDGLGGKLLISARHNATSPYTWTDVTCAVIGNLNNNVKVYASDGKYIYIAGGQVYSGISVDRMLVGDTARYDDQSGVVIDVVSSLPSVYQTAKMIFGALADGSNVSGTWEGLIAGRAKCDADGNGIPDTYAKRGIYGDTNISMGRRGGTEVASGSIAVGNSVEASGSFSQAVGNGTVASGDNSHAGGYMAVALENASHAMGYFARAGNFASCAIGKGNRTMAGGGSLNGQVGDAFVIGNGSNATSSTSNAFRVTYKGETYGIGAFQTAGADYAEFIKPWSDGNPENEDRVGYFVTVKDGFLLKAGQGDYIAGITSGNPSIVGNADEDYYWRYERDAFNRIVMEDVPEMIPQMEEVTELVQAMGEDGTLVFDEGTGDPVMVEETRTVQQIDRETGLTVMVETGRMIPNARMKLAEGYDPSLQDGYIERKYRPEWDYVGMLGVLPVRDDGTCIPGRLCRCADGGIATLAAERGLDTYMVVERVTDNIVSVILK